MYGYSHHEYLFHRTQMHSGAGSFMSCAAPAGVSDQTEFLISRSHSPSARARRVFNVVLDSGHFRAGRSYRVERRRVPGHELLYCVNGSGYVASEKGRFRVEPFHLVWLSGFSAQWADEITPWEVLWMRVEGHQMEHAWAGSLGRGEACIRGAARTGNAQSVSSCERSAHEFVPRTADAALNCRVGGALGIFGPKQRSERASEPAGYSE